MTKTVTIDIPIEVRKTGPDEYQYRLPGDDWSGARPESYWRRRVFPEARAIVQAIDSGAFVDPLPTAANSAVYIKAVDAVFTLCADEGGAAWSSTRWLNDRRWHTPEQVQSYGPFEVLYDPEAQS